MRRIARRWLCFSLAWLVISLLVSETLYAEKTTTKESPALAVLEKRCVRCHNARKKSSGLDLSTLSAAEEGGNTGDPALVPKRLDASLLWEKISHDEMPPEDPLPTEEQTLIRAWIEGGAPWERQLVATTRPRAGPDWWSIQPLQSAPPPKLDAIPKEWTRSPVDRFVYAKLQEKGLKPTPAADRRTLIRRATYDLTGLPPTPEDVEAFVTDTRPDAYERLLDRLLASPHYGERWGRHWLDVVRFGESNGYEQNHVRNDAWPFRDYVIRSFNDDKPFDQMVLEHLAGDQIAAGDPDVSVGTGFLVAGPHDTVGNGAIEALLQARANDLDDMIGTTSATFLGLTVNCSRCHDHKFDPILQTDYYRLQAVFAGVRHGRRSLASPEEARERRRQQETIDAELATVDGEISTLKAAVQPRIEAQSDSLLIGLSEPVTSRGTEEAFAAVEARFVRFSVYATTRGGVRVDEFEVWTADRENEPPRNVALASAGSRVTARNTRTDNDDPTIYSPDHLIDGGFAARWISGERGGTGQFTIELARPHMISHVFWSRDRLGAFQGKYQGSTPRLYEVEISLDGQSWTTVADSSHRRPPKGDAEEEFFLDKLLTADEKARLKKLKEQREEIGAKRTQLPPKRMTYVGSFAKPEEPTYLMKRGNPMSKGALIPPGSMSTLASLVPSFELDLDAPEGERRLALASWITHDLNPLTPRVLANRIWHYHFGRGIVSTPSDFGFNGARPTHPELLDWLARRVHLYGWRLKPLHREIMLTMTYRQSSQHNAENAAIDGGTEFLWRYPVRRLAAEEIRDTILTVSGQLDPTVGGPGFRLYKYTVDNVATYHERKEFGPDTYRRAVYHQAARSVKVELLGQYDCPDSALPAPRREETTSPGQALSLLNHHFVIQQAEFLAARVVGEAGEDPAAQVERAFRLAHGRAPDAEEAERAKKLIQEHGLMILCRALFNTNEFVYVF